MSSSICDAASRACRSPDRASPARRARGCSAGRYFSSAMNCCLRVGVAVQPRQRIAGVEMQLGHRRRAGFFQLGDCLDEPWQRVVVSGPDRRAAARRRRSAAAASDPRRAPAPLLRAPRLVSCLASAILASISCADALDRRSPSAATSPARRACSRASSSLRSLSSACRGAEVGRRLLRLQRDVVLVGVDGEVVAVETRREQRQLRSRRRPSPDRRAESAAAARSPAATRARPARSTAAR